MSDCSEVYVDVVQMIKKGLHYSVALTICRISHEFPTMRGFQISCDNTINEHAMIYLTRYAFTMNSIGRTISHESIHSVVDEIAKRYVSASLDKVNRNVLHRRFGQSVMDVLFYEGYLGED